MTAMPLPRFARISEDPRPVWDGDAQAAFRAFLDSFPLNVRLGLGLSLAEHTEAAAHAAHEPEVTLTTLRASIARLSNTSSGE